MARTIFKFEGSKTARAPLLVRAQDSADAFADFYDEYGERVLRYLARRVFDVELAYDMHAEVFAICFERRRQFRGHTVEEEQGWLFSIARSQIASYRRHGEVERGAMVRLKLDRPVLDDESIDRLEELAELESLKPLLAAAMQDLPADQRDAVTLRVVNEHSYEEIAARQGVTKDLVRARVSRGLRALARALDIDEAPDEVVGLS